MWILIAAGLTAVLAALIVLRHVLNKKAEPRGRAHVHEQSEPTSIPSRSILSRHAVDRSIANGAPSVPWMLRREDRDAIEAIKAYFARAIPNPTPEGRPFIEESLGFGGPQLELKVPIISSRRSVAVIFRSWDPERNVLESNLYFAGRVNDRLARIASNAGFELAVFGDRHATVFRSRPGAARQRSA